MELLVHTHRAKTFFQLKKTTAFSFPFSEAQLPCNTEHNQRLVRDRGILTRASLLDIS